MTTTTTLYSGQAPSPISIALATATTVVVTVTVMVTVIDLNLCTKLLCRWLHDFVINSTMYSAVVVGLYPIATLEKQLPNMIGNLVKWLSCTGK